jgi:hypothetical protein
MKNVWLISMEKLNYFREGNSLNIGGQLRVIAGVQNLAYEKRVGLRYTIDNFQHVTDIYGEWSRQVDPEIDEFTILTRSDIPPGVLLKFALFYQTAGQTYWDSNDGIFYSVQF